MNTISSFTGCLIGGDCGDALGYEVEFDKLNRIKKSSEYKVSRISVYMREQL